MAAESRRTDPGVGPASGTAAADGLPRPGRRAKGLDARLSVDERLGAEGYRFDFFQAVRLLQRRHRERKAVGENARPADEVVRFRAHQSIAFPPSQIVAIEPRAEGPAEMTVAFMGLTGPLGVLPRHYTELVMERTGEKATALRDFLDLFNHRLISLFYRAWEKHHFPVAYERAEARGAETDRFSRYLFDLIGMGTGGLQQRLGLDDRALLFFVGLLAQRPHSASALQGFLREYFGVAASIRQFVGAWLPLAEEARTRIGLPDGNGCLGVNAVVGSEVWLQDAGFHVHLGPLTFGEFSQFLPGGAAFRSLVLLVRFFAGQEFDFAIRLILRADEVPTLRLGAKGQAAPRLGWSTWLKTRPFTKDPGDTILAGRVTGAL